MKFFHKHILGSKEASLQGHLRFCCDFYLGMGAGQNEASLQILIPTTDIISTKTSKINLTPRTMPYFLPL